MLGPYGKSPMSKSATVDLDSSQQTGTVGTLQCLGVEVKLVCLDQI